MTLAPYYRIYELPWSPTAEVEQRFRKVMRIALILFVLMSIVMPLLPTPEKRKVASPDIPDRIVKLVIEKKAPPPPPPPPKAEPEKPKPEPKAELPKPPPPKPDAREKAQNSGLLKYQDQFAALRDSAVLDKANNRNLSGKVEATRSERSLITSKVGRSSGGINTAGLSRGYGGSTGALKDNIESSQVSSAVLDAKEDDAVQRTSGSNKAARSREEIELIFDRNKGAIYALYSRALRDNPGLQGKVVLELTIAPTGEITRCEVVSSELNDPELERKLVARIKLFRFEARDVEPITTTKPIDFFPA